MVGLGMGVWSGSIPDIVSICTWHSLHHTQTIDIAKRGVKAIICEKPMAIGSGPAQEMLDACNKNNVNLSPNESCVSNPL